MRRRSRALIPLTDLQAQYAPLREQIVAAVGAVLDAQDFILGARVSAFEGAVAELLGAEAAVGVSSGSDALLLALLGAGIGPGDEVITTPLTFVATAEAIVRAGARPVFVDVSAATLCLDPDAVLAAITPRTRALLPVHLFGQPAALGALGDIASRHDLSLIEDAAQAFGARHDGRFVGTVGHYGALSFFPAKILGGAGDGGMLLCSAARAERIRALRLHGSRDKQTFEWVGGNYRLDALQAAILSVKLPYALGWVERRRARADAYCRAFEQHALGAWLQLPSERGEGRHAYNHFVVRTERRASLMAHLTQQQIGCAAYYATPLHLQPCFASLGYRPGQLPAAEAAGRTLLALPLFPELSDAQIACVVEAVARQVTPG